MYFKKKQQKDILRHLSAILKLEIQELLLSCSYGSLAEFLELLHEFESCLACACTGSLVSLNYLSLSVYFESINVGIDLINELLHFG